jgi:hypothetical protein
MQDTKHFLYIILRNIEVYQLDFISGILGFFIIRFTLPNILLKKNESIRTGLIIAFCYSLWNVFRSYILQMKTNADRENLNQ